MLDTGIARPPSPTYTAITPVTRAPVEAKPAAKTDLPVENTVTPSTGSEKSQGAAAHDRSVSAENAGFAKQVDRRNVVDPETQSFIYVATDMETGEVVRQVPSETLRRLRAYAESMAAKDAGSQQQSALKKTA